MSDHIEMPVATLMKEHRLIERMITLINKEIEKMESSNEVDVNFIDLIVDFFRTYTDRNHHGKEEHILFKEIDKKANAVEIEYLNTMERLIKEHEEAREKVGQLSQAKEKYSTGELEALQEILGILKFLMDLYPKHIETEDKHFFIPSMTFFTKEEIDKITEEFEEFDKQGIHENYVQIVKNLESLN